MKNMRQPHASLRRAPSLEAPIKRNPAFRIHHSSFIILLSLWLAGAGAAAQSTSTQTPTDGATPLALSPGAPAGAYPLSGFDTINPYNGHLNFRLPLLQVGGRGEARYTITLPIEQIWQVGRFYVDGFGDFYFPDADWWSTTAVGYGPGRLQGRMAGVGEVPCDSGGGILSYDYVLTRLTFTAPDGTEYELRDQASDGKPLASSCTEPLRGRTFVTADGTAATFVADADITDYNRAMPQVITPSGTLVLRDGTRYRINSDGLVEWLADRNGNRLAFTYGSNIEDPVSYRRVTGITDSLNRKVTISYADMESVWYDTISYRGFGGSARVIRVWYDTLGQALRLRGWNEWSGFSLMSEQELFPKLNASSSQCCFGWDRPVVTSVELPDGRRYWFRYNPYGELARVELPTGGAFEYDYPPPEPPDPWSTGVSVLNVGPEWGIYRRLAGRRVYSESGQLQSEMVFSDSYNTPLEATREQAVDPQTTVTVDHFGQAQTEWGPARVRLGQQRHYFYGDPRRSLLYQGPVDYPTWKEGREVRTETVAADGSSLLQELAHTWLAGKWIDWWASFASANPWFSPQNQPPPKDPVIAETVTRLLDTGGTAQVARQMFLYDTYNNRTDLYQYDYGWGAPGPLLRRIHTDYLTANNGRDYAAESDIHLRSLPLVESVFDGSGAERARTVYEYDNYSWDSRHSPLIQRPGISGLDSSFGPARGNVTGISRWLDTTGQMVSSFRQYDMAGNVVRAIDGRGNATAFDFADRFGVPDGEARANSGAPELGGQSSYAFATAVTHPLGQTTYSQVDYYLGQPVDLEDANGVVTSARYDDWLDRPTQGVRAANSGLYRNQTTFSYSDWSRTIVTSSDRDSFGDNLLRTELLYDGLGRTVETRQYEGAGQHIAVRQSYDGLGRIQSVSNPFRPWSEGALWTASGYDALGRVVSVTPPDGAVVRSAYSGNSTTVTDPAGKVRRTTADALGRLTEVIEDPYGLNYRTRYQYDAADNLTAVVQGGQTRTFAYDSLGRLTAASNPESGQIRYVQYDENGNLLRRIDARGVATDYRYDALDRLLSRSYSDGTPAVLYQYDAPEVAYAKGRVTSVRSISPSGTTLSEIHTERYDPLGRVEASRQVTEGQTYAMSYRYNLAGQVREQTYPSGRIVTTGYDGAGRIAAVETAGRSYASWVSYAPHGAIRQMKLGNGLWEWSAFNSRQQPVWIGVGTLLDPSSRLRLELGYDGSGTDNNGNLRSQTITAEGQSWFAQYDYDGVNRLAAARENGGSSWRQAFVYDAYGNRRFDEWNTAPAAVLGPNPAIDSNKNQPVWWQGYQYDAAGNLTADASGGSYQYDAENRQIAFNGASGAFTYTYDGLGRRIAKTGSGATTVYVYNAFGQLVAEYSTSGGTGAGARYLTQDPLGSTRLVTDKDGAVASRHDYLPFGEEIPASLGNRSSVTGYSSTTPSTPRQKFTGKERDTESGLDYFGARYLSSAQGRFTSTDPLNIPNLKTLAPEKFQTVIANPHNWNAYAYAHNNPLAKIDPDGYLTLVVPGTHWRLEDWNDDSEFVKRVSKTFGEKAVMLNWSGANTDAARRDAAKMLAEIVKNHKFAAGEKLNIVAHSHGGNIAFIASKSVDRPIDNLVTLGTPIRDDYKPAETNIRTFLNVFSSTDKIQIQGGRGDFFCYFQGECGPAGRTIKSATNVDSGIKAGPLESHSLLWQDRRVWEVKIAPKVRK